MMWSVQAADAPLLHQKSSAITETSSSNHAQREEHTPGASTFTVACSCICRIIVDLAVPKLMGLGQKAEVGIVTGLQADANLGGSKPYPRCLSHCSDHLGNQLTQLLCAKHLVWYLLCCLHKSCV